MGWESVKVMGTYKKAAWGTLTVSPDSGRKMKKERLIKLFAL